jgi:sarcosine oxidase subunit alpha
MSRVTKVEKPVTIELDGEQLSAREGEPAAAAVIASGELLFARSPKYHRPRGPWCMSGGCSHCLMRVDGVPNVPTCRVPVKAGMRLERQNALPDAKLDLLRASDFIFQKWFNHHEFLAGVPIAEQVLLKVARQLSGLGVLPDTVPEARAPAVVEHLGTVIVGAGPAGLAVARRLEERGQPFTLIERERIVGGRLVTGAEEHQPPIPQVDGQRLRLGSLVVGLFIDEVKPFLAVVHGEQLHLVFYERLVLAVGGHPTFPTFPNNDLPGVMAARAVSALVRRHGVLPGQRVACVGEPSEARALAQLLTGVGAQTIAVGAEVVRAHGLRKVEAVTVKQHGSEARHGCDVIAVCAPVSPAFELARAAGAKVSWEPNHQLFVVEADVNGRTSVPGLFVVGELRGPVSSAGAVEQGVLLANALTGGAP